MNNPLYFEIQADELVRAKTFYESVFKWKIIEQPGMQTSYYRIETEGIAGGLLPRPAPLLASPSGTNAATISMEVHSFDETARVIIDAGGKEALPKFAVPGKCWQGYFVDTEGNTFGIFEVDVNAQ